MFSRMNSLLTGPASQMLGPVEADAREVTGGQFHRVPGGNPRLPHEAS